MYEKFPTPLINRLEKHFVLTKTILLDWQNEILKNLEVWVDDFCNVSDLNSRYSVEMVVLIYLVQLFKPLN